MAGIWFDEEGHPNVCFERGTDDREVSEGEAPANHVTQSSAETEPRACKDVEIMVNGVSGHICNVAADTSWAVRDIKKAVAAVTKVPEHYMDILQDARRLVDCEEVESIVRERRKRHCEEVDCSDATILECSIVLRPVSDKSRLHTVRTVVEHLIDPCNIARCRVDGATVNNCKWVTKSDGQVCPAWPASHFCSGAHAKRLGICEHEIRAAAIASSASTSRACFCFRVDPDERFAREEIITQRYENWVKIGVRVELIADNLVTSCESYTEEIMNKLRFGHTCDISNYPENKYWTGTYRVPEYIVDDWYYNRRWMG